MAAYGASKGELNRDGNQDLATDDYLATPDQRFPSVSSQGIEEKIILLCTMEIPAYVIELLCSRIQFEQPASTSSSMHLHI